MGISLSGTLISVLVSSSEFSTILNMHLLHVCLLTLFVVAYAAPDNEYKSPSGLEMPIEGRWPGVRTLFFIYHI